MSISRLNDDVIMETLKYMSAKDIVSLYESDPETVQVVLRKLSHSLKREDQELYIKIYSAKYGLTNPIRVTKHAFDNGHIDILKLMQDLKPSSFGRACIESIDLTVENVRILLNMGIKQYIVDRFLLNASASGKLDVVQLLFDRGVVHSEKEQALVNAAREGHNSIVQLLIENGADVHAFMNQPARESAEKGHTAVVRTLLDAGADMDAIHDHLISVAERGNLAGVNNLVRIGADINIHDDEPLKAAARAGRTDVVRFLLDNGANRESLDYYLMELAGEGDEEGISPIIRAGADVHAGDDGALINAVEGEHTGVVMRLIEAGADVNAREGEAVQTAIDNGDSELVRILAAAGARFP
jgi:ankyrin repeat protein